MASYSYRYMCTCMEQENIPYMYSVHVQLVHTIHVQYEIHVLYVGSYTKHAWSTITCSFIAMGSAFSYNVNDLWRPKSLIAV